MRRSWWLALFFGIWAVWGINSPSGRSRCRAAQLRAGSGHIHTYWVRQSDPNKLALYANQFKLGIFDLVTRQYQRVNADGTLAEPTPAPPALLRQLEKAQGKPGEPTNHEQRKKEQEEKAKKAREERERAERAAEEEASSPVNKFFGASPTWVPYAIGGAITLLITGFGLIMQFRKD